MTDVERSRPVTADAPLSSSPISDFIARHGWRAYALPILAVVTVVALATTGGSGRGPSTGHKVEQPSALAPAPPTASGEVSVSVDTPAAGSINEALASDALPAGPTYTQKGAGTFRVLAGTTKVVGTGTVHKYTIDVENGITGVDLKAFAAKVDTTLDDPRSWTHQPGVALQRVDSEAAADFHVTLTSSFTVRSLCGYEIQIETSCWSPGSRRVTLNVARYVRGDAAYVGDVDLYRTYMINHENGHALGHLHAHQCLANGLAPVMMQQTIGLKSTTGATCQANPWPYPVGVAGAPGVEAPDTSANNESTLIKH